MTDKETEIQELKKRLDELEQSNNPQETNPYKQQKSSGEGCFKVILVALVIFIVLSFISGSDEPKIPQTPEQLEAERNQAQAERTKGFHCLSGWDGSHSGLVRRVKSTLRNPSSFEHVLTRIGPVNASGEHLLSMTYRAENGFGGLNTQLSTGTISNSSCSLIPTY